MLETVLALLGANGGKMSYQALYDALDYQQRQNLPGALREGKKQNKVRQDIAWNDGVLTHDVVAI